MVEMNSLDSEKEKPAFDPFASSPPSAAPPPPPPQQHYQQQQSPPPRPPGGDFVESMLASVNQDLLISKTFYFFFFSAFGSLFPLMGIFFKQLGMNPVQCGLLVGFRPFVEFLSAPFWGTIADQFRKGKLILLFSLVSWLIFTLSLGFIKPPPASCIIFNSTHHILTRPQDVSLVKREVPAWMAMANDSSLEIEGPPEEDRLLDVQTNRHSYFFSNRFKRNSPTHLPPGYVIGQSPGPVHYSSNYDPLTHNSYIKPVFSKIVYKKEDVKRVFFMLLLVVVIGEFFSAPAITLADSVTLTYLGENANNYGKQRMFGSLGWGVAMFFVGIALDHSTAFPSHPCGPHEYERNYTICFAVFSVLMGCAFITATQFRFDYDAYDDSIPMKAMPQDQQQDIPVPNTLSSEKANHFDPSNIPEYSDIESEAKTEKSKVFASTTTRVPEWLRVLRTFANLRYGAFLFVAWFMGFGIGLVFTFLFWHLQDLGGSPTLFGVASVINHISEILAYFFSFRLIKQIGHVKVLCLGLIGNVARFLYVSWLTHPWWVLPFELIQGITHAAVWAACCSYITQATPMNLRSSAQGVLQGLHHGLGRGCGAVIGGLIATYEGTAITFRVYGFLCALVLIAFVLINFYRPDEGFTTASDEPHQVLEDNYHLDPHGVPSSPMPRVLSSSRLEQLNGGGSVGGGGGNYGSLETHTTGGFLDIPKGGGGGGGMGGGGSEGAWTQIGSAIYTGGLHGNQGVTRARKSLASAFQLKGSPVTSPEAVFDYDFIRNDFQAYSDVLFACNAKDDDASNGNVEPLKAPLPIMALHNPQPDTRQFQAVYDW